MNGDWIEHNGGPCPEEVSVAAQSRRRTGLRFRNGGVVYVNRKPSLYTWEHSGHPGDIVAYRIESAVEPKQEPQADDAIESTVPIPAGWRHLGPSDVVQMNDLFWVERDHRWLRVSHYGYTYNGVRSVIIRQLPTSYHRGCGAVDVGVDR